MTIFMYVTFLCMGACTDAPITSHFLLNHELPATGKPALYMPALNSYPLTAAPAGDHHGPKLFQTTELPGDSPIPKQCPPIIGRLIT